MEVKRAVPKGGGYQQDTNHDDDKDDQPLERTKKIFVGGLPHSTTDNEFRSYFSQFGTITDYQVMRDRGSGRPRGFGFVS